MPKEIRLSDLAELLHARLIGDGDYLVSSINTLSDAVSGEVSFLSNERYQKQLSETAASAVILHDKFSDNCSVKNLLIVDDPYVAFARAAQFFYQPLRMVRGVHKTAVVDESAIVAASASIGAQCVIGAGACVAELSVEALSAGVSAS